MDTVLLDSQQDLQQIKNCYLQKLQEQEKYIGDRLQQLQEDVSKYEDQLRDADPNPLLQFKQRQMTDTIKHPFLETIPNPIFSKGKNNTNTMQSIFGHISTQVILPKTEEIQSKSLSCPSSPDLASPSDPATSDLSPTSPPQSITATAQRSLIATPSVQSEFSVHPDFPYIACANGSQVWVRTGHKTLQLMDRNGSARDSINTKFYFSAMSFTFDGDLLLDDYGNKYIKLVSRQRKISTLFETSWGATGLCCLHNNNIVVTFCYDSKVVVYNRNGEIIQTLDHIELRHPRSVAVNKVNRDIYICDLFGSTCYSTGKVITIGVDGQLQYEYAGQGGNEFAPVDVCTDQMGNVLITDYNNHRVHILDQKGQFIQYALTLQQGLNKPNTISVDKDGYIWVGQRTRCIKVARYLH